MVDKTNTLVSQRVIDCERSLIRKIKEDVSGHKIEIDLGLGVPDFPIFAPLAAKIKEEVNEGSTNYAPNQGEPKLITALANYYKVEPNQIIVTIGAAQAIFAAMFSVLDKGDGVTIIGPAYPAYSHVATLLGVKCNFVDTDANGNANLEKLKVFAKKSKMIIACSPNNPDGNVLSSNDVNAISEIAEDTDVSILADECYETLSFEKHNSFLAKTDKVIKISSASKMYSATGIRIGWMIAQKEFISQMIKVQNFMVSGAPTAEQKAVAYCLENELEHSHMKEAFAKRAEFASKLLTKNGIMHVKPKGAFYVFPKVPKPSYEFCLGLAKEKGLLTIPGSAFDFGEGHLRLSLAAKEDKIERGIELIKERIEKSIGE